MSSELSPIERIPTELLCNIFGWCIEPLQPVLPDAPPLVLLNVCKRWRAVASAYPDLWTDFSVTISETDPEPVLPAMQRWLGNTGSNNLNVSIRVDGDDPYSYHALYVARPLLEFLDNSHSVSHWKSAILVLPAAESFLKNLFRQSHPILLESLNVDLRGWDTEGTRQFSTFLSFVPKLKELTWADGDFWGVSINSTASFLLETQIPWRNLTHLLLDIFTSLNTTYRILSQCADLQILELTRFALGETTVTAELLRESQPIWLPQLRSMTIRQRCLNHALALCFDFLVLPKLKKLDVKVKTIETAWPNEQFISLLKRSSAELETLRLLYVGISEPELLTCLEHNSMTLTTLEVREPRAGACISERTLLRLTEVDTGEGAAMCPRLRNLILSRCIECPNGSLKRMLRSRRWGIGPGSGLVPSCTSDLEVVDIRFAHDGGPNSEDVLFLRDGEKVRDHSVFD